MGAGKPAEPMPRWLRRALESNTFPRNDSCGRARAADGAQAGHWHPMRMRRRSELVAHLPSKARATARASPHDVRPGRRFDTTQRSVLQCHLRVPRLPRIVHAAGGVELPDESLGPASGCAAATPVGRPRRARRMRCKVSYSPSFTGSRLSVITSAPVLKPALHLSHAAPGKTTKLVDVYPSMPRRARAPLARPHGASKKVGHLLSRAGIVLDSQRKFAGPS